MWHTQVHRIRTAHVLQRLGLRSVRTYVTRRQLQWAGHVARMEDDRLPRRFLTSWCGRVRPVRRPELTYGAGLTAALVYAGVMVKDWMDLAQDRVTWEDVVKNVPEPEQLIRIRAGTAHGGPTVKQTELDWRAVQGILW